MFCKHCGRSVDTAAGRCPHCGKEISALSGGTGFWELIGSREGRPAGKPPIGPNDPMESSKPAASAEVPGLRGPSGPVYPVYPDGTDGLPRSGGPASPTASAGSIGTGAPVDPDHYKPSWDETASVSHSQMVETTVMGAPSVYEDQEVGDPRHSRRRGHQDRARRSEASDSRRRQSLSVPWAGVLVLGMVVGLMLGVVGTYLVLTLTHWGLTEPTAQSQASGTVSEVEVETENPSNDHSSPTSPSNTSNPSNPTEYSKTSTSQSSDDEERDRTGNGLEKAEENSEDSEDDDEYSYGTPGSSNTDETYIDDEGDQEEKVDEGKPAA